MEPRDLRPESEIDSLRNEIEKNIDAIQELVGQVPLITQTSDEISINSTTALALFRLSYNIAHAKAAINKIQRNKEEAIQVTAEDALREVERNLGLIYPDISKLNPQDIIKAIERSFDNPSRMTGADIEAFKDSIIPGTKRKYGEIYRDTADITAQMQRQVDDVKDTVMVYFKSEIKSMPIIRLIDNYESLSKEFPNAKVRKEMRRIFHSILHKLGEGHDKELIIGVERRLRANPELLSLIKKEYETQYNLMANYVDAHKKKIQAQNTNVDPNNPSLLDAQLAALERTQDILNNEKQGVLKECDNPKNPDEYDKMKAYRFALIKTYTSLTTDRPLKIGIKEILHQSDFKIIQKNNSKIASFFNGIINKLAKLVGKRRPETFLTNVNMWISSNGAKNKVESRILRAANVAHVKVLTKRFGIR